MHIFQMGGSTDWFIVLFNFQDVVQVIPGILTIPVPSMYGISTYMNG